MNTSKLVGTTILNSLIGTQNSDNTMLPSSLPFYGPYDSLSDAVSFISDNARDASAIPVGLTVGVEDSEKGMVEWWITSKPTTSLTSANFSLKYPECKVVLTATGFKVGDFEFVVTD